MEIIIAIVVIILGVAIYFNRKASTTAKPATVVENKVEKAPAVDTADIALAQMPAGGAAVVDAPVAEVAPALAKPKAPAKKPAAKKAPAKKATVTKRAPAKTAAVTRTPAKKKTVNK
jgi:DNA-binding protein HU-beta